RRFDCVLVEPVPGEFESFETTAEILRQCAPRGIPAVLYTPRPLSPEKEEELARISQGATVRVVRSLERVLDQVALFLHVPTAALPVEKRDVLESLYSSDAVLAGKRVLLVDDDIRNIFAMTSVLERQNMEVLSAETGKEAIDKLDDSDVDIVLMDIMMPDMDGYDTMREIRKKERFRGLPIIAVTAKAMKGDREKTLQAGAWDYLAKPVDTEQMLSVLRSWLHR
ncbi:MAG TPA: response regulator, partial [Thermoanaerobaculia bacterium]|nr:response regulator [Thermoanaerobaculia bacterium]